MNGPALERTLAAQARAADPRASAWVRANAGTGKTHVLVRRVLRLLLEGAAPEGIVCLTFTKAAAAEMAGRLTRELGAWAVAAEAELQAQLTELLGRAPVPGEVLSARRLFASVLDTPGGLRIQTIHSFCERILRQFPLEAGVVPGFTVLSEQESRARLRHASTASLEAAATSGDEALAQALETVAGYAREDAFEGLLDKVLCERACLRNMVRSADAEGVSLNAIIANALGAPQDAGQASVAREQARVLSDVDTGRIAAVLEQGSDKTDRPRAERLREAANASDDGARITAFRKVFLTDEGKPRADSRFFTKAVENAAPDVAQDLRAARDRFAELELARIALATAEASAALLSLCDAIINNYEQSKRTDGALDYDDLIERTVDLLTHGSAWVLYRLDGGIDHLLIDEAQDNSRAQWRVAELLCEEFFAGEGAREAGRSIFAVGDEKQSIYGFQGAAPEHFAALGEAFRRRAQDGQQDWHDVPLTRSFRSVPPVLEAVDLVFGGKDGLGARIGASAEVAHEPHRAEQAGLVEVWPTEKPPERPDADPFAPLDEPPGGAGAAERLAGRIADRIKGWLDGGETLASQDRPIRAGDILILVRKRDPFAAPMIDALKARGIPVAGADRMRLTDQLAVKDLMALGDALLLPGDDLSLAAVLKSPIFGLSENDLFALAHGREGSLWEALELAAETEERFARAEAQLARWRGEALASRPFEFYASVLDRDGARGRILARMRPEAADAIDEFLGLTLAYEESGPASLQGFLAWLREAGSQVRRDMEQGGDQVRVMTVHGAKGLQANIVILPDTCTMPKGSGGPVIHVPRGAPGAFGECLVWAGAEAGRLPAVDQVRRAATDAETAESYRLLYVAMTRACDRLYVTGFENRTARGRDDRCWYETVRDALDGVAEKVADMDGQAILRLEKRGAATVSPAGSRDEQIADLAAPAWLAADAPSETAAEIARPSSAEQSSAQPKDGPAVRHSAELARLRGEIVHELLEALPEVGPGGREAEAGRIIERVVAAAGGVAPDADARAEMVAEALAIIEAPEFAHLFGPGSRAEVPVAAQSAETGRPVTMSGRIDRLVVRDGDVLVIDYKTDARVPARLADVPERYTAQLAAYSRALAGVFPDKAIRPFILWTRAPALMEMPADDGAGDRWHT